MKIIYENGMEISSYDESLGYLEEVQRFVRRHEAIAPVKEEGHYETVAEYENGGKDVRWVVDIPGVEGRDAWDEYETVMQFIPYTTAQLAERRVTELKHQLSATDYAVIKIAEGAATFDEYAEVIAQRAAWRQEINELEEAM